MTASPVAEARPIAPPVRSAAADAGRLGRDSLLLMAATVLTGAANYGFMLVLVWILPPSQFSELASVNALILVMSAAAVAGLPWVVTRAVARSVGGHDDERRQVVTVTLGASIVAGLVGAALLVALSASYASPAVEVAGTVVVMVVFAAQVGSGYLQGQRRFAFLAALMIGEAFLKVGLGAALAVWAGAVGALGGAAAALAVLVAVGLWVSRRDIGRSRRPLRVYPWGQIGGIGGVQAGVATLTMLDVIVGSILHGTSTGMAGYQAMLVFARAPIFLAGAISGAVYPLLVVDRPDGDRARIVRHGTEMYVFLAVPVFAAVATLPRPLIALVLPAGYVHSASLLVPLALAGAGYGLANLATTFFQAESAFALPLGILWCAIPVAAGVDALCGGSLVGLAWAAAALDAVVAVLLVAATSRRYRDARVGRLLVSGSAAGAVAFGVLRLVRPQPIPWCLLAALLAAGALAAGRAVRRATTGPLSDAEGLRL